MQVTITMDNLYFVKARGEELGPLTFGQLRSMWQRGEITVETLFRMNDGGDWQPLVRLRHQLDNATQTPPLPPKLPSQVLPNVPVQTAKGKHEPGKKAVDAGSRISGCGCLLLLAFVFVLFAAFRKDSQQVQNTNKPIPEAPKASNPVKTPAVNESKDTTAAENRIKGKDWFGASSRELREKMAKFAVQKDSAAFGKLMTAGLLTGEITMFKDGEKVILMDTAIFSGLVKVRREGEIAEFWTNFEAIK